MESKLVDKRDSNGHSTELAHPMKPYYAMAPEEKKAYRRGNRKRFIGFGSGLVTAGGAALISGLGFLSGDSVHHVVHQVAGFEIITTAVLILGAGAAHLLALLPWEDA